MLFVLQHCIRVQLTTGKKVILLTQGLLLSQKEYNSFQHTSKNNKKTKQL